MAESACKPAHVAAVIIYGNKIFITLITLAKDKKTFCNCDLQNSLNNLQSPPHACFNQLYTLPYFGTIIGYDHNLFKTLTTFAKCLFHFAAVIT